jgi:prepilin-type processing-associated H-X9-DG protein
VQGVTKIDVWKRPSDVIYVIDAVEESLAVQDPRNTWKTLQGIRENIDVVRGPVPPGSLTGLDWFDVPGGESVPLYPQWVGYGVPRAALKMHVNRGSNGAFVDGHVELVKPPSESQGIDAVRQFYYRKFGVNPQAVPLITSTATEGSFDDCTAGDVFWQP